MINTVVSKEPTDLFRQAMETFESAVTTSMKLEEELTNRCADLVRDLGSPLEWEKTVPAQVRKSIASTQQTIDQSIRCMNENAKRSVTLLEMAFQIQQSNGQGDGQVNPCVYALESMRASTNVILQSNARVLESWGKLAREVTKRVDAMVDEVNRATEEALKQA